MDKDKDIHDEIENEIEGIVYDDNDTDATEEEVKQADKKDVSAEDFSQESESEEVISKKDAKAEASVESGGDEEETASVNDGAEESSSEDEALIKKDAAAEGTSTAKERLERRLKKLRHKKLAWIIPSILIVIAGMVTAVLIHRQNVRIDNLLNVDSFYEGIYVDDIALGGLTYEQALQKLEEENLKRAEDVTIELDWDEEAIVFKKDDVDISFDTQEVLDKAWLEGRSGTDRERYDYVLSLLQNPVKYSVNMDIDPAPLEARVKALAIFRQREPGEASVKFDPDPEKDGSEWFEYSEPEKGIKTDAEALWTSVSQAVMQSPSVKVSIPKWEVEPTTTIEDLKNMTQLIVQFKSNMVRNSNREHNVRLACSMINGTVLMPGEIFSMNETTGRRTKAAGFKEANVIVSGNRLEPGIAGGVCQVSGTLFNAAVRADLEIVERHHHSFELGYLTRGRDATVDYGTADLRFKNTSDHPIYISMYTIGRDVYAEIYGVPLPNGMSIKLYVKTTKTVDPGPPIYIPDSSIVPWESPEVYSARTGIKCTTYKDYYDPDGKLVERVELHRDYYRPFAKEVRYNPTAGMPAS